MYRSLPRFILLLGAAAVLSSCDLLSSLFGGNPGDHTTTLKVLNRIDTDADNYADFQDLIAEFEAQNPDILLEWTDLKAADFDTRVAENYSSNTYPDVQYLFPNGSSTRVYQTESLMKDLQPLLGDDFLSDFLSAALDVQRQESGYLAVLPMGLTNSSVMFANKALLQSHTLSLPTTYNDLKNIATVLGGLGTPIRTVLMANGDSWVLQSCLFSALVGRLAGDSFLPAILSGSKNFTDSDFVAALTVIHNLGTDGILDTGTAAIGYGTVPETFANHEAAFLIDGDWRVGAFTGTDELIPSAEQESDYEVIAFPTVTGEKSATTGAVSVVFGGGFGINKTVTAGSEKEAAAVKLLKFLYSAEVQEVMFAKGLSGTPTRKGLDTTGLPPLKAKVYTFDQAQKYVPIIDVELPEDLYNAVNDNLHEMVAGNRDVLTATNNLQAALDTWRN